MKIAHIASHKGNVGDILNHVGFYRYIISDFVTQEKIDRYELRDFYFNAKKRLLFDRQLAEKLNQYDLVIIGGGGFFDARWSHSSTGTSLDFSHKFIETLSTKIIVNAMGYHEYFEKTTESIIERFLIFLNDVSERDNWLLTVRNDGSMYRLRRRYGIKLPKNIIEVPDNAFYLGISKSGIDKNNALRDVPLGGRTVGMCITNDLFSEEFNKNIKPSDFNSLISYQINSMCEMGIRVQLIPHTPSDIDVISKLLANIESEYKRKMITVGMLDCNGNEAVKNLNKMYSYCDCMVGMRFHSCVSALNRRIPTIALAGHEQILGLFNELNLGNFCIKADNLCFKNKLLDLIVECLEQSDEIKERYVKLYSKIEIDKENYKNMIRKFVG